jgi:hypothetical protein
MVTLSVVSGAKKMEVGSIQAEPGLRTSSGRIERITPGGSLVFDDGTRVRSTQGVTVAHSEATRWGYPDSPGSTRFRAVQVRRNGELVTA